MKTRYYHSLLLLCTSLILFTCERDDLCPEDTPTTPSMTIEFRDTANPENTKNVTGLRIENPNDSTRFFTFTGNKMVLPLKTDVDKTSFIVYKGYAIDDNAMQTGNPDTLTISYTRDETYVSRACGYKTTFKNVAVTIEADSDNWMLSQVPTNDNQSVINEDETHWNIRH